MLSNDITGTEVLTSVAPIESLHWFVFVEQPVVEVYRRLNAAILRTGLLLLPVCCSPRSARWRSPAAWCVPSGILEQGAQRIGAGELDQTIDITRATSSKRSPTSSTA